MKVSELSGALLDYWVGKAEGFDVGITGANCFENIDTHVLRGAYQLRYDPSTNWTQGGPIIEREHITVDWLNDGSEQWMSYMPPLYGPTPLVAAMRCFVASKFGEEVEDVPHA